jgi:glucose-1-phosphate cytidylyltransferase
MKVVILAGGYGTRIAEETDSKPKPMVMIGDKPILWHIMKIYSAQGFNEFVILLGYKGEVIKNYFINYLINNNDISVNTQKGEFTIIKKNSENWKINLVDTGLDTMTGGRLKLAKKYLDNKPFMLTYGDGLSNVNLKSLISFHNRHNPIVTLTGVQLKGRFGTIDFHNNLVKDFKNKDNLVKNFREKPNNENAWVNGGFFICDPKVFDYIKNTKTIFEKEPLQSVAKKKKLYVFKHNGFWHPMDTISDHKLLNKLWLSKNPPWKIWK